MGLLKKKYNALRRHKRVLGKRLSSIYYVNVCMRLCVKVCDFQEDTLWA